MIICQCNVLRSCDIKRAVEARLQEDPYALITPGKVFILALQNATPWGDHSPDCWEYDTATHTFTEIGTSGAVPACPIDKVAGCILKDGKYLLLSYIYASNFGVPPEYGVTTIFDRATSSWTYLSGVTAPAHGDTYASQTGLANFRLANVHGRPLLVGDNVPNAKVWEFKTDALGNYSWSGSNATFPPVTSPGFCSTLGGDSLPTGKAMLFGGWNATPVVITGGGGRGDVFLSIPQTADYRIFSSVQSGLIAVTYNGVAGISLSSGSSFAVFEIPVYNGTFDVAAYRASFAGRYIASNLKVEVSFDNGGHWHEILPDSTFTVTDSDNPAVRRMRVTMYNSITNPPILTKLTEALDEDGGEIEDRLIIRYDAPDTVQALYIDRFGMITLSDTIEPSTPLKAIIHKVTPNGSSAPTIKNYINRRKPHIKYSNTRVSGGGAAASQQFDNELAVPVRYVDSRVQTVSTGVLYKNPEPTVDFDADAIAVADVANDGDTWIVELEG